jgi:hypothetical protein
MTMTMKVKSVLMGGVAAGVVYNVSGMASALLVNLPEIFSRFGVAPTSGVFLLHLSLRLGLGLASVVLYAGMRAGYGTGPKTAVGAGFLVWFIGYVPSSVVLHELGVFTGAQLAFAISWGLAEAVLATSVGARIYR